MTHVRPLELSLRQLEYLVAVADHTSFGAAANACGVAQPSLSAQVAKAEEALGIAIFERSRPVRASREGERVLAQARAVLAAARALEAEARALSNPAGGEVEIALIPTLAPYLLPRLHPAVAAALPELQVHWRESKTEVLERQLVDGSIDLGLLATLPEDDRLEARELGSEAFVAALPGEGVSAPITLAELTRRPLLLLDEGHCLRDQTLAVCARHQLAPTPFQATSLATLVQLVAAGVGVTLLPACAAPIEAGRAKVHLRPLVEAEGRPLILAWRRSWPRAPLAETLGQIAARVFAAPT